MAEEDLSLVLDEAREAMQKSLDGLKRELAKVRTGRANPALLEGVQIDYYGSSTPLKKLATVSAPEARLLVVQPFDPSTTGDIERGILKADLGFSPVSDGKMLRLPIPELTGERRKALVKGVKKTCEEYKVAVRSARRDAVSMLKSMEKDGDITEDESHRGQAQVQQVTDEFTGKLDDLTAAKEKEILTL